MARTWRTAAAALIASVTGVGLAVVRRHQSCRGGADRPVLLGVHRGQLRTTRPSRSTTAPGLPIEPGHGALQRPDVLQRQPRLPALTINLTGDVGAGDVFVARPGRGQRRRSWPRPTRPTGPGWFNGDDAVVLRRGTTVLDVIGQVGTDPGTEWGTGLDQHGRQHPAAQGRRSRRATPNGVGRLRPVGAVGRLRERQRRRPRHPPGAARLTLLRRAGDLVGHGRSTSPVSASDRDGTVVDIALTSVDADRPRDDQPHGVRACRGRRRRPPRPRSRRRRARRSAPYTLTITATNDDGAPQTGDVLGQRRGLPRARCAATPPPRSTTCRATVRRPRSAARIVTIEGVVTGDYQGPGGLGGYYVQEEDVDVRRRSRHVGGHLRLRHPVPPSRSATWSGCVGRASEFNGQTQVSGVTAAVVCSAGGIGDAGRP